MFFRFHGAWKSFLSSALRRLLRQFLWFRGYYYRFHPLTFFRLYNEIYGLSSTLWPEVKSEVENKLREGITG